MAKDLLHLLWQKLPQKPRRVFFDHYNSWLAPQISSQDLAKSEPFVVAGVFRSPTGLGEAARLAVLALQEHGKPVYIIDLTEQLKQPCTLPLIDAPVVPDHLENGTLLLYANPPVCAFALRATGAKTLKNLYRIGCWVWEYPQAPKTWKKHAQLFHEIAAPSQFAVDAIARTIAKPVRLLIHPVAARKVVLQNKPKSDVFAIGFMGDMIAAHFRKNPLAIFDALLGAEIPRRIALYLYLRGANFDAEPFKSKLQTLEQKGIELHLKSEDLNAAQVEEFYQSIDLYISLHRCEGFGLTLAEAMLRGVPCVSTNWSATAEFINDTNGYPVHFESVTSPNGQQYAEPDISHAQQLIKNACTYCIHKELIQNDMQSRFSSTVFIVNLI